MLRRLLEMILDTEHEEELHIVLLDWAKAFDKVNHNGLILSLERLGIPSDMIESIKMLYKNPQFRVKQKGKKSEWYRCEAGIRQGCPLSPYLFIAWMSVLMFDVDQT